MNKEIKYIADKPRFIRSIGCYTGIRDTFLVYGKYFTRVIHGDSGVERAFFQYHIWVADGFDPWFCDNLYSRMDFHSTPIEMPSNLVHKPVYLYIEEFVNFINTLG
jgi:hypothetical protein